MDLLRAPGYGREKQLLAKTVYVTPSEDRRKARFRTHLAEVVRPSGEEVDLEALGPFTRLVRANREGGAA